MDWDILSTQSLQIYFKHLAYRASFDVVVLSSNKVSVEPSVVAQRKQAIEPMSLWKLDVLWDESSGCSVGLPSQNAL